MNCHLERKKGILDGTLVIKGTRVPITRILYLVSRGRSIEYIIKTHYPFLSVEQVQAALKEVADNLASIKNAK